MTAAELAVEIASLPKRIEQATLTRNNLWRKLQAKWSEAFVNTAEFVSLSNQTEAAGKEVMVLTYRLVQASRLHHELTSGHLN